MRIGGRLRVWLALGGMLLALAAPSDAAAASGELVLRGTAGGRTYSLPAGIRLAVPDGYRPAPSGRIRGFVITEASTGALVVAAASLARPGFDRVDIFQRGQGYEQGRLTGGRYRFTLLGDAKGAKDIVLPVEGLRGRRVLELAGGSYQRLLSLGHGPGNQAQYRAGELEVAHPMGLIWAWAAERGNGVHHVQFCLVPQGGDCPPETGGLGFDVGPKSYSATHLSVPSTRPPGKYEMVLDLTTVGESGKVAMVGFLFI